MPKEHKTDRFRFLLLVLVESRISEFHSFQSLPTEMECLLKHALKRLDYYTGQGLPPEGKVRDTVEAVAEEGLAAQGTK